MTTEDPFTKDWSKDLSEIDYTSAMEQLESGGSIQELLQISDDTMELFYQTATKLLKNKRAAEAADAFLVLTMIDPFNSELWVCLGNAEIQNQEVDNALNAYSMAMLYNGDDPFPHLYSANIYLHLDELEKAEQCLKVAIPLIDENPENEPAKAVASALFDQVIDAFNKRNTKK